VVLFMGVRNLESIVQRLVLGGREPGTQVSVIEQGTMPSQRIVEGTLKNIAAKVRQAKISSPALTVIGDVNRLRPSLKWFERKPLKGKRVLVTRPRRQNQKFKRLLQEQGAEVVEAPLIRIEQPKSWAPLDQLLKRLQEFDWIVFSSVHAVENFFKRLKSKKKDARSLSNASIAVVGTSTAQALEKFGVIPDLVPKDFHLEALMKALIKRGMKGKKILFPRTHLADDDFKRKMTRLGAEVGQAAVYRNLPDSRTQDVKKILGDRKKPSKTSSVVSLKKNKYNHL